MKKEEKEKLMQMRANFKTAVSVLEFLKEMVSADIKAIDSALEFESDNQLNIFQDEKEERVEA